jgi:hypothetical protein
MSTPPSLVPLSHHVPQNSVHPESPSRWSIIVGVGIVGAAFLFIIYRLITESSPKKPPKTAEKKDISRTAPIEEEKALCIFRIFREALGTHGAGPIPIKVMISYPMLGSQHSTTIQKEYTDIVSFLPKNEDEVWIQINADNSSEPLPEIKLDVTEKTKIYEVHSLEGITHSIPLKEVFSPRTMGLEKFARYIAYKKISFSKSPSEMELGVGYESNTIKLVNYSDLYQVVQMELKHSTDHRSVSLSYSIGPQQVHQLPLVQIIEDYQDSYKIKYRQDLLDIFKPDEVRIISITYTSYRQE